MARRTLICLAVFLFAFCAAPTFCAPHDTGFLNRTVTVDGADHRYEVYVPREWNAEQQWPVILFLHGHALEGDDGLLQTDYGISGAIRRHADRFPSIVVFPQSHLSNEGWMDSKNEAVAMAALDQAMKEFRGDPDRVYLTGLSMGGYGTYAYAVRHPGKFAAFVVVCGGIQPPPGSVYLDPRTSYHSEDPYALVAAKIGKTPIWIFHGEADPSVPVAEARHCVEVLKAAGANVKYSEFPEVGHNSWDRAYNDPELMPWLLSQHLSSAAK